MAFDWKSALGKLAPMIATAVGGPFGGMAASAALEMLGLEPEKGNEEAQLQKVIESMTPEQAIAIKTAEQNFRMIMRELDLKEEDLHTRDRDSARKLAASTSIVPQVSLSIVYSIGYFLVLYLFITGDIDIAAGIKAEFNMVLGVMTAAQIQIMNFWFGSSSGSKAKSDAMLSK